MKRLGSLVFAALMIVSMTPAAQRKSQSPSKIALLDSEYSRSFFKAHYTECGADDKFTMGADEFMRYFGGWLWVLEHEVGLNQGQEFDILLDEDITVEMLSNYGLLILPNTPSVG
jgi:hypothetical protein